ncbi:GNAT family N-acetyltransferase [Occultella glacieicola]|uniref:GNAT family N-acetyltransferase n=1 Tax=Occultella glacieicola TaxID=2518684 RepID=A0ABY2E013_9MICO|nr:GNAT family N-acetyltransferase [Occultella glacieicola]TDE88938.1 GNAT family N-acetyltransferase [Occultella glacieicola]
MTQDSAPENATLAERARAPRLLTMPSAGSGLTWRPLGTGDVAELHALFERIETHDNPPYRTTLEEAAETFQGEWKDAPNNSLGGFDGEGVLRAYGTVTVQPGDVRSVRAFLEGGVDPLWRRRSIGTAVLRWQVDRSRQVLAASGKDVPGRIVVHVEDGMTDSVRMLQEQGFSPRRWYTEMRRDLGLELPAVKLRSNLDLVPWSAELDDQVRLAHNDSFRDHWGSEPHTVETWQEGRTYFAPTWSFLVLDRTTDRAQVAGYLLSGRYEQDWESLGWTEGYIDILGVRREWRGQRIATALLARAMAAYREDGMEYAGLGIDTEQPTGAFGLYGNLQFEPTRGSTMYTIEV